MPAKGLRLSRRLASKVASICGQRGGARLGGEGRRLLEPGPGGPKLEVFAERRGDQPLELAVVKASPTTFGEEGAPPSPPSNAAGRAMGGSGAVLHSMRRAGGERTRRSPRSRKISWGTPGGTRGGAEAADEEIDEGGNEFVDVDGFGKAPDELLGVGAKEQRAEDSPSHICVAAESA